MTIDDQQPLETMAFDAAREREQHGAVRGKIEGEGAAELHMVFGHAAPKRWGDEDRHLARHRLRGTATDAFAQDAVDTDRQVRAMLLHGGDRKQHDGVVAGLVPQLGGGQLAPDHSLGHQYVTLPSMKRNCRPVKAMTISMSSTDWAAELPRSPPRRPSRKTL